VNNLQVFFKATNSFLQRDLILVQHQYNNCTITPHMRVGPSIKCYINFTFYTFQLFRVARPYRNLNKVELFYDSIGFEGVFAIFYRL
jgi:hypothetical protein